MENKKIVISLVTLVGLSACGGGSDSGNQDNLSPTAIVSPPDQTESVALNTDLTATFNEDIFATTLSASSFTLSDGNSVAGTVSFDENNNVATFNPTQDLRLLTRYTGKLAASITDLSGNPLIEFLWDFTTVDGSWGTAEYIETDNTSYVSTPTVVAGPNGHATAIWAQDDGSVSNINVNHYVHEIGWRSPILIETSNVGNAFDPDIAVDINGNNLAVWRQDDGAEYSIYSNNYTSSGWGTAELIETSNTGSAYNPKVVMDSSGNGLAVWFQANGSTSGRSSSTRTVATFSIYANRYTAGSGWGTAELLETDETGHATDPKIVIDKNGNATAIWTQKINGIKNIMSNRYVLGTGWGTAELVESSSNDSMNPDIGVDGNGNVIATWVELTGGIYNAMSSRYIPGTGWSTETAIESSAFTIDHNHSVKIAVSDNGNAIAVWTELNTTSTQYDVVVNHYTEGTGWGTEQLIESNTTGSASEPTIVIDGQGNALVVWSQDDGFKNDIWSNRYVSGSGWGAASLIETDNTGSAYSPKIDLGNKGNAFAVWVQDDGTQDSVAANLFD